jgi:PIN domain
VAGRRSEIVQSSPPRLPPPGHNDFRLGSFRLGDCDQGRAGKIDAGPLIEDFDNELDEEGFRELPLLVRHAVRAGLLRGPHKDSFDRMLAAQALAENLALISREAHFDSSAVGRIW